MQHKGRVGVEVTRRPKVRYGRIYRHGVGHVLRLQNVVGAKGGEVDLHEQVPLANIGVRELPEVVGLRRGSHDDGVDIAYVNVR